MSQRVAEALDFRSAGTAHVKVEWLGRANLAGDNDSSLLATLRDDGAPATLDGLGAAPIMTAEAEPAAPARVAALAPPSRRAPKKLDVPVRQHDDALRLRDSDMTAYAEESAVHVEEATSSIAAHTETTTIPAAARAAKAEHAPAEAKVARLDDARPTPLPPSRPEDLGAVK